MESLLAGYGSSDGSDREPSPPPSPRRAPPAVQQPAVGGEVDPAKALAALPAPSAGRVRARAMLCGWGQEAPS